MVLNYTYSIFRIFYIIGRNVKMLDIKIILHIILSIKKLNFIPVYYSFTFFGDDKWLCPYNIDHCRAAKHEHLNMKGPCLTVFADHGALGAECHGIHGSGKCNQQTSPAFQVQFRPGFNLNPMIINLQYYLMFYVL
eukprot:513237_1